MNVKIECPRCQQHIEVETPVQSAKTDRLMHVLAGLCLVGILVITVEVRPKAEFQAKQGVATAQDALPAPAPTRWEYKVIDLENSSHEYERGLLDETNRTADEYHRLALVRMSERQPGGFNFTGVGAMKFGSDWDLVTYIPLMETPGGDEGSAIVHPRIGQLTLIFKRPAK